MPVDSLGFLRAVEGLPEQLAAAHEQAEMTLDRARLPRPSEIDTIAVLGMGGSGIAGDVLRAVASSLPVPIVVLKQIRIPAFVGPRTLVFAVSYSGNTEETNEMTRGALDAGAPVVAITAGGELAELATTRDALHVRCADGLVMPRAAIGALVAPLFVTLFQMGLYPEAPALLVQAQAQLKRRAEQCRPDAGPGNPAQELARKIGRSIPLVYGGGALGGVAAYRWKCDINENAKAPAFSAAYPELDHNEITGWGQHGDVTRQLLTLVSLRHGFEHEQLAARIDRTTELIEEALLQVLDVEAQGEGRLAQLLDLMYLGDWVSYYLAVDNDVDPGPIDAIAQLKAALAAD
ncbi:MAG TPA: bifunctional phosphoglucose/phosphomannose isomerase [Acidimicrobiia bacterium]|nr:bifunctional phosphoglucose/phosphomannose isomerase [Acidimicrobiia bacterium]